MPEDLKSDQLVSDPLRDMPANLFAAHLDVLEQRLAEALDKIAAPGLVVAAGRATPVPRDDQSLPFRVDPYFNYWCPLPQTPGAVLILEPGHQPELSFPAVDDYWHAAPPAPASYWAAQFGLVEVGDDKMSRLLESRARGFAFIGDTNSIDERFVASCKSINSARLIAALDYGRASKTDYEIECIRRANVIACAGHRAISSAFVEDLSEFELNVAYLEATQQREHDLPYGNIVALNEHAATLHYQHLDRSRPDNARTLLVDAGATVAGYAADVTRTTLQEGSVLGALRDAIERMQQTLCSGAIAGVSFVELNQRAHELVAEILVEHELASCSADEALNVGLTRVFLPHGLGHLLGLQVHDVGGKQSGPDGGELPPPNTDPHLRLTRVLEEGFVVTIEPGIYFIRLLLERAFADHGALLNRRLIDALQPFGGIRIEDDVVVQSGDNRNLTREAMAPPTELRQR